MERPAAVTPLHRHQIAWLTPAGWQRVCDRDWDVTARACLTHWAAHGLPLVVTRQPRDATDTVAMGLPAPGLWERRRIALSISRSDVLYFDEFPIADKVTDLLPKASRGAWRRLCAEVKACGAVARVYGSYGWQCITELDHAHSVSDIDIWVAVSHPDQADAVAAVLQAFSCARPRLDGELMFDGSTAVAWREWQCWRAGLTDRMLVKHLSGVAMLAELSNRANLVQELLPC
jgi:phosphoribosyl-dephospho-CoA transferase